VKVLFERIKFGMFSKARAPPDDYRALQFLKLEFAIKDDELASIPSINTAPPLSVA
jgi:hypothetical protein